MDSVRLDRNWTCFCPSERRRQALAAAAAYAEGKAARLGTGRGTTFSVSTPFGMVVCREYRHGGILAGLTGGVFRGKRRFLLEVSALNKARAASVAVPRGVGVLVKNLGAGLTRGILMTEWIENAGDLLTLLREGTLTDGTLRKIARETGLQVRRLHDAGLRHPDLHLKNVLYSPASPESPVWLIDFDKAGAAGALSERARAADLARLWRSWEKLRESGEGLPETLPRRFLAAYAGKERNRLHRTAAEIGRRRLRIGLSALRWRFLRARGRQPYARPRNATGPGGKGFKTRPGTEGKRSDSGA